MNWIKTLLLFALLSVFSNCQKQKERSFLDQLVQFDQVSSNTEKYAQYEKDSLGIPLIELNGKNIYYPITIGLAANTYLKNYKKTDSSFFKESFMNHARWLRDNFTDFGNYGFWLCEEDFDGYSLKAGWPSAMGQGLGLTAMFGAYQISQEEAYLAIAKKAVKGFEISINDNGFTRDLEADTWYEEYPTEVDSRVLNGFLFALCGLYNYYEASRDILALNLYHKGEISLRKSLEKYNNIYTSRYSLYSKNMQLASAIGTGKGDHYHHLHIVQLIWMYEKSKNPLYIEYAHLFLKQDLGPFDESFDKLAGYKILSVEADKCIDCENFGPDKLNDGRWSYGPYWSTNKNSNLQIDLGERRENINRITLFSTQAIDASTNFLLYAQEDSLVKLDSFNTGSSAHVYVDTFKTANYETYIYNFPIQKAFAAKKLRLEIRTKSLVALREIDFQFDRTQELNLIRQQLAY